MSDDFSRIPLLEKYYQHYLDDENSATFIKSVSHVYRLGTLERLAGHGGIISRRAAVLSLGFLGDFRFNETMGRALSDSDRAVRILADHGIREIWLRDGAPYQQKMLRKIMQLNNRCRLHESIELADNLIAINPNIAETWNQRAIAKYGLQDYSNAIEDCRESMYLNRFHFGASLGVANCYMQLEQTLPALEFFRLAISINPDMECVRTQIDQLERTLEG